MRSFILQQLLLVILTPVWREDWIGRGIMRGLKLIRRLVIATREVGSEFVVQRGLLLQCCALLRRCLLVLGAGKILLCRSSIIDREIPGWLVNTIAALECFNNGHQIRRRNASTHICLQQHVPPTFICLVRFGLLDLVDFVEVVYLFLFNDWGKIWGLVGAWGVLNARRILKIFSLLLTLPPLVIKAWLQRGVALITNGQGPVPVPRRLEERPFDLGNVVIRVLLKLVVIEAFLAPKEFVVLRGEIGAYIFLNYAARNSCLNIKPLKLTVLIISLDVFFTIHVETDNCVNALTL